MLLAHNKALAERIEELKRELRVKEEVVATIQSGRAHGYGSGTGYGGYTPGGHGAYQQPRMYGTAIFQQPYIPPPIETYPPPEPRDPGLWTGDHTFWHPGRPARARCRVDAYSGYAIFSFAQNPTRRSSKPAHHDAPAPLCTCGLHAHYDLGSTQYARMEPEPDWVVGAVAAWGRVEAHSRVFRAEYMQPVALGIDPGAPPRVERQMQALADLYAVAVVPLQDLAEHALQFGTPIPQEYRGRPRVEMDPRIPTEDLRTARA